MKQAILWCAAATLVCAPEARAGLGVTMEPAQWKINVGAGGSNTKNFTIENSGTQSEDVFAKTTNSANWTAGTAPAANVFTLSFDDSGWKTVKNSYGTTSRIAANLGQGSSKSADLKFQTPTSDSSGGATQNITIGLMAMAAGEYTYNAAGDFYWKDVGAGTWSSDWSGSNDHNFPNSLAQYMTYTSPAYGWGTLDSSGNSPNTTNIFADAWVNVTSTTGSCPICSQSCLIKCNSWHKWLNGPSFTWVYRYGWRNGSSSASWVCGLTANSTYVQTHWAYNGIATICTFCGKLWEPGGTSLGGWNWFQPGYIGVFYNHPRVVVLD